MQTHRLQWTEANGWSLPLSTLPPGAQLILYFGSPAILARPNGPLRDLIRQAGPAIIAGCSTAGEIFGPAIFDESLSVIALQFHSTTLRAVSALVPNNAASESVGSELGRQLRVPSLRHVLLLSDGLQVNGTALVRALRQALPDGVSITGGLAGDGPHFRHTLVGLGPNVLPGQVVAIGFHGEALEVGYGIAGGWTPFGPHRLITRSEGNILYALDDQPALALYKRYLGDRAAGLPGTGLLFPLQLLTERTDTTGLVRTILAVDEATQSVTFAGDLPQGQYARLMKATSDALIGSTEAAGTHATCLPARSANDSLALVVSCVGRRLLLGQRCEEEIDLAVRSLPPGTAIAGFYSYGEIAPSGEMVRCDLHNQTLVMTVLSERTCS